jgi:hypothetical protein
MVETTLLRWTQTVCVSSAGGSYLEISRTIKERARSHYHLISEHTLAAVCCGLVIVSAVHWTAAALDGPRNLVVLPGCLHSDWPD